MEDNMISLGNVEVDTALKRALVILKARVAKHDRESREFEIMPQGIELKESFVGFGTIDGSSFTKDMDGTF